MPSLLNTAMNLQQYNLFFLGRILIGLFYPEDFLNLRRESRKNVFKMTNHPYFDHVYLLNTIKQ
jgi:hypothetical protein